MWGVWHDDAVLFGTSPSSLKARNLADNPRLVVHLESGDEVVILEGTAEQITAEESVADAYEAKYDHRPSVEGLWQVRPTRAFAWTESDYPKTATRYAF